MLSIYVGNEDVYIVKGKLANDLKLEACIKVPYSSKEGIVSAIYNALSSNKLNDNEVTFVTESAASIIKYITVDENAPSIEKAVLSDLQRVFVTTSDYVVSYDEMGSITIDGEKKRNILAAAAPGSKVGQMIELSHLVGLSPRGMETGVSAMSKLVKVLPQVQDGKYSILMVGEGDYLTVTLYYGKEMLFSRYVPLNASITEVLDIVSLMGQYLARLDKKAKVERLLYTASRNDSKNVVSIVSNTLGIPAERLEAGNLIKCKNSFAFDEFAFMLGSLDTKRGINLFRDSLEKPNRKTVKVELEMTIDDEDIYRFTKRLAANVYALGGDVKSLNINKK